MMVVCLLNKTKKDDFVTPPAQQSITVSRSNSEAMSSVTMSADSVVTSAPAKKAKIPRSTATAMQLHCVATQEKKKEYNTAFKCATVVYAQEKGKDDGMSARTVADLIRNDCGISLSPRTIQKKVKEGEIGCSPLRHGPKGNIPELHYKNLCAAFESFVTINQINGNMQMCSAKKYGPLVFKVVYGDCEGCCSGWSELLKRVQRDTVVNLNKCKSSNAKDSCIRWTNHRNIPMWFDNWEHDLVELGFAVREPTTGKIHILEDQLGLIGYFDETCLSLNGNSTNHGGRPEAFIYNPRFPVVGKATCKNLLTSTLITGSTAAGEAFLPHIQYVTKAKTPETMHLDVDVAEHVPRVLGKFGCEEERTWPVLFGQNEKGGMDEEEFAKYLFNSIVPLFPHAKDKPGHCILLKVDLGPGRMNLNLLANLRLLGFVLYPCVPNTTHVTQETDQNYGPFKTQFLSNLELIVDERLTAKKSLSLQQKFVGLPLFVGVDRETQFNVEVGAFQKAFVRLKYLVAYKKVGAAMPEGVTRACLNNPQVLQNISNNGDDDITQLHWSIQAANDRAIHALKQAGYDAACL
jgi:hypothetical protein